MVVGGAVVWVREGKLCRCGSGSSVGARAVGTLSSWDVQELQLCGVC